MREPSYSFERESGGIVVGTLILTLQAGAIIPGLLPSLVLLAVFALPLLVLGAAGFVLVAVPVGLWRLAARAFRGRGLPPRAPEPSRPAAPAVRPLPTPAGSTR